MKKFIVFAALWIFLTGMVYAQEKFQLEFGYENFSQGIVLVSKPNILSSQIDDWRVRKDLIDLKGNEVINRSFLKASYSIASWLKLNALVGIGRSDQEFQELDFLKSSGYLGFPELSRKEKGYSISSQGEMGFLYGLGAQLCLQKKNFSATIETQYIYQEERPDVKVLFDDLSFGYGDFSCAYWQQKAETRKVKNQELKIGILLSGKMKRVSVCAGPELLFSQTSYTGKAIENLGFISYWNPRLNHHNTCANEFEFKTKNKNLFGVFTKVDYALSKITKIFLETRFGARDGLTAGLNLTL